MKKIILIIIGLLIISGGGIYFYSSNLNEDKLGVKYAIDGIEYDPSLSIGYNDPKVKPGEFDFIGIYKKAVDESFYDAVLRIIDSDGKYCKIEQPDRNKEILDQKAYKSLWVTPDYEKYEDDIDKIPDDFGPIETGICSDSGFVAGNWFSYFIYNPDVPDKIIFIDHGQAVIWSDYDSRENVETTLEIYK